jgi:L-threonylcarbamoyladenylate synthase
VVWPVDRRHPDWPRIRLAAAAIRQGQVIAIPTDTVYGLAGDPFRPAVVERIFEIKGRAKDQPILLLIASLDQLHALVRDVPPVFRSIAARFWPGPLTVILPASERVPPEVTGGTGTVAVRWPAAVLVQAVIREAGRPLTGTSANRSGRPAAGTAAEVERQLGRSVYGIVDGGRSLTRLPSTILDLTGAPRLVRRGALPAARLAVYLR